MARRRLRLKKVDSAEFDQLLQETYESGSGNAMQMVEGLEDGDDLLRVAEELPEPSDLLESDDDAPIIRLINALLAQAVKENASDIHIRGQACRTLPYRRRVARSPAFPTSGSAVGRLSDQGDVETRYR